MEVACPLKMEGASVYDFFNPRSFKRRINSVHIHYECSDVEPLVREILHRNRLITDSCLRYVTPGLAVFSLMSKQCTDSVDNVQ